MKLSEKWIREFVKTKLTREELIAKLNMAGLETSAVDNDVLEFELTPNRGDCLSVHGMAREIAALTGSVIASPRSGRGDLTNKIATATSSPRNDSIAIIIDAPQDCPRYVGRIIQGINPNAKTPIEMQRKLESAGVKIIHPIVDILNYVMFLVGQPFHAFDLDKLQGNIVVRRAKQNELLTLLNEQEIKLTEDVLVIADEKKAHALAGVMGGLESAVSAATHNIFIESAFFNPVSVAGRGRRYGLHTDGGHRFERGVDPHLAAVAIELATQLIIEIAGGKPSALIETVHEKYLPPVPVITLRAEKIKQLLGIELAADKITEILKCLNMNVKEKKNGWEVMPPSYRFDIKEEVDLIEELARLEGYDNIPVNHHVMPLQNITQSEKKLAVSRLRENLVDLGYQEAITYSFISESQQALFNPQQPSKILSNPLSAEYAVMRSSLWPSLLQVVQHNLYRQQTQCRFFETGLIFPEQHMVLSGVIAGVSQPEQWAQQKRPVDFFDMKGDLEQLFALTGEAHAFHFEAGEHAALHPTQAAKIYRDKKMIGWCGALHPEIQKKLDIEVPVFVFELELNALEKRVLPYFKAVSKFPAIRRDIALLIDHTITAKTLESSIRKSSGNLLQDLFVFDVYQGKNIPENKKSMALGLVFQTTERTLVEEEINAVMDKIITTLQQEFSASLRQ